MTYEEVKDVLHKYLKLLQLVKLKEQHLQTARACMGDLQGIDYSRSIVKASQAKSCVEMAVERIDRLECDYMRVCERLFEVEDKMSEMLPCLNEDEQVLIIERYMRGVSIRQLQRKYYYASDISLLNKFTKIYQKLASGDKM